MLTEVMTRGTAAKSAELGLRKPAAGKTGTTEHFVDACFLGYTEGLACGVWVGYDHPKTIMRGGYGAVLVLPIPGDVMQSPASDHFAAGPLPQMGNRERVIALVHAHPIQPKLRR